MFRWNCSEIFPRTLDSQTPTIIVILIILVLVVVVIVSSTIPADRVRFSVQRNGSSRSDNPYRVPTFQEKESIFEEHIRNIEQIIRQCSSPKKVEGNSVYHHLSLNRYADLRNKQINLFHCGAKAEQRIFEVGFNAGHSAILMLLGRDPSRPTTLTICDIAEHAYMKPCVEYVRKVFPNVVIEYIIGDSTRVLPKWIDANQQSIGTYDVFHVDGCHSEECAKSDLGCAVKLTCEGGTIIVDDTNIEYIDRIVEEYIASGVLVEDLSFRKTQGYEHRVLRKNRR